MSRTSLRRQRLRFFERGNTHCPICLIEFSESDVRAGEVVTLEHVPQKSIGGRPACLTCTRCNTGPTTSAVDQAVARHYEAEEQGGYPITIDVDGRPLHTVSPKYYEIGDGQITITTLRDVVGEARGPATLRSTRPWPEAIRLGLLKSAYLMVFNLLGRVGYRFAQSEAVRFIRKQLQSPEEPPPVPILVKNASTVNTEPAVWLLPEHQCWVVMIRTAVVVLPPGGSVDQYKKLSKAFEQPLTMEGIAWTVPQFMGDPTYGEKGTLKGKHLFGRSYPVRDQACVVVYEDADMVALRQRVCG